MMTQIYTYRTKLVTFTALSPGNPSHFDIALLADRVKKCHLKPLAIYLTVKIATPGCKQNREEEEPHTTSDAAIRLSKARSINTSSISHISDRHDRCRQLYAIT